MKQVPRPILVEGEGKTPLINNVSSILSLGLDGKAPRDVEGDSPKYISEKNREEYNKFLKENEGEQCAFILGNGVSIPLGADSWDDLVANLLDCLNPYFTEKPKGISAALSHSLYHISSYTRAASEMEGAKDVYEGALRYCIYRKYTKLMHKKDTLLRAVALAKLKYKNLRLYTYNYDLFLENQIEFEDKNQKMPDYSGDQYSDRDKTQIVHLHGVIYDGDKEPSNLVLTADEYYNVYLKGPGSKEHWVRKAQIDLLSTKKVLFIGSSMSDLFQLSIIKKVKERKGKAWKCYALMCFKDLDSSDQKSLIRFYKDKGIHVIFAESFSDLPRTLNSITGVDFSVSHGNG